jgi:uncharacterized membrane protein YfcA
VIPDFYFLFIGAGAGILGTLIGVGGGFVLTPLFLFLFPELSPSRLTALSLIAVFANSLSGSLGYALRRRVHWQSVIVFSLAGVPGILLGVQLLSFVPRAIFEQFFALFLVVMGAFILWRSFHSGSNAPADPFWNRRASVLGAFVSFFVGILSSLLGIGGGIIYVPLMSMVLGYPVHIAIGCSTAILALTSLTAVADHVYRGNLTPLETFVPYLVVGLVAGAQAGAHISKKVSSRALLVLLSLVILVVSFRLFSKNMS